MLSFVVAGSRPLRTIYESVRSTVLGSIVSKLRYTQHPGYPAWSVESRNTRVDSRRSRAWDQSASGVSQCLRWVGGVADGRVKHTMRRSGGRGVVRQKQRSEVRNIDAWTPGHFRTSISQSSIIKTAVARRPMRLEGGSMSPARDTRRSANASVSEMKSGAAPNTANGQVMTSWPKNQQRNLAEQIIQMMTSVGF
nr:hypothetical protein CFP56_72671 [Quercus suber]